MVPTSSHGTEDRGNVAEAWEGKIAAYFGARWVCPHHVEDADDAVRSFPQGIRKMTRDDWREFTRLKRAHRKLQDEQTQTEVLTNIVKAKLDEDEAHLTMAKPFLPVQAAVLDLICAMKVISEAKERIAKVNAVLIPQLKLVSECQREVERAQRADENWRYKKPEKMPVYDLEDDDEMEDPSLREKGLLEFAHGWALSQLQKAKDRADPAEDFLKKQKTRLMRADGEFTRATNLLSSWDF